MVLCLRFVHSVRCSFFNIMPRLEPVRAICRPSDSDCGDDDGPQFICCVDRGQPKIHEVQTFGEDGVSPKVHPAACIYVSNSVGDYSATNCLTPTWRRVPMSGRKLINESIEWLGIPSFPRNDGPPWTLNILDPYADWGGRGSSISQNFSSGSGGYSDSVFINCNRPARVLPIYHRRIFNITCSNARCNRDNLLTGNHSYCMQIPYICCNPIHGSLFNERDDPLDDFWDFSVRQ